MYAAQSPSAMGSITQMRTITEMCMQFAKTTNTAIILIWHVNKDGDLAGPKILEHLVDTVLFLEGSRFEQYRMLRTFKNRFGPTDEVGLFSMTEKWLIDIANPGMEFINLDQRSAGSTIGVILEWTRPLLVEIEALTTYTKFGYPKRSARGIPTAKLDLLLAVLSKFSNIQCENYDVYVNLARWLKTHEPAIDLALVAAIVSSRKNINLEKTVFLGEISLTGHIKTVIGLKKRLEELDKLGFSTVYIAKSARNKIKKRWKHLTLKGVDTVREFVELLSS